MKAIQSFFILSKSDTYIFWFVDFEPKIFQILFLSLENSTTHIYYTYICTREFHLMDVSMDQPQQHWIGELEGQEFYVEFSHFLKIPQGNLLTGIDNKTITWNILVCSLIF